MAKAMYQEERRQQILRRLEQHQRVSVNELSDELGVSAVTIRQDLRTMEQDGLLIRTHGGATLPQQKAMTSELAFEVRLGKNRQEKEAIGKVAAQLVKNNFAIAMDGSTTALAIAPHLKQFDYLVIATNSLIIAQQFLDKRNFKVLLPAGQLRIDSVSLVGAPETLPDVNFNIGFFGAHGVTLEAGITEMSEEEASIKGVLMSRCVESYILVDSTKWDKIAPFTFADVGQVKIITTTLAPSDQIREFRKANVQVDAVPLSS